MGMARVRLLLVSVGIGSFVLGASGSLAACGGDDATSTDQDSGSDVIAPTDSGGQSDTGGGDSNGDTAKANATDITIYLGQIAALDATTSTPAAATFAWTIESAPAGSTVVTSSILNAATAKPTFTPDLAGDYAVKLTVTSGSATDAKSVKVKAVHAPVFYVGNNSATTGGGTVDVRVVSSGGTDGHSVMCGAPDDGGFNPNGATTAETVRRAYSGGTDWWEGAAGSEARVAFTMDENLGDGGYESYLATGTSASTCLGTKPKKVDTAPNARAPLCLFGPCTYPLNVGRFYFPRFAPDGNRIVYVRNPSQGSTVATIAFDGTTPHASIAAYNAYPDGGAQADAGVGSTLVIVPPRWAPGNKVAWASAYNGSTRWNINVADDADNAIPTVAMSCSGTVTEFDFLADGTVIALGQIPHTDASTPATDLIVYRPNAVTKECEVVKNLTSLPNGSVATDFALSPDKRRAAFLVTDVTVDAGTGVSNFVLFTVSTDGSTAAAKVPGVPTGGGLGGGGPHWIAGGTALVWGQKQETIDAGDAGGQAIAVVSAGGGNARAVAQSTTTDKVFAIGNMCSIGHGGGSALMAFGSLAAFVGLVVRRRRRTPSGTTKRGS